MQYRQYQVSRGGRIVTAMVTAVLLIGLSAGAALATGAKTASAGTDEAAEGRLRLIISLQEQEIDIYRGTTLLQTSPISSGKKGLETPMGVYSILQKRKFHRSNIYSNAPMPFMQRITWSGIALHGGRLPGYAASHGCIRLPMKFAKKLFTMTQLGADVIVTAGRSELQPIDHPVLFQPARPTLLTTVAANDPPSGYQSGTQPGDQSAALYLAALETDVDRIAAYENRSVSPLRILVTRRTGRERMLDVQRMLAELGHPPGDIDGYLGPDTGRAIQSFQRSRDLAPTGMFSDDLVAALYDAVGRSEAAGHLYVRQNYIDLFDAPVTIRDPDAPLGTHMFTADQFETQSKKAEWVAVKVDRDTGTVAAEVLDRIEIPDDVRQRINTLLVPGSSLVISDAGLGRETGKGTDFIVQP